MLFFTVAAPIYIPVNSVQGFLFFYTLGNICYCGLFDDNLFWQMGGDISCGLDLYFPND